MSHTTPRVPSSARACTAVAISAGNTFQCGLHTGTISISIAKMDLSSGLSPTTSRAAKWFNNEPRPIRPVDPVENQDQCILRSFDRFPLTRTASHSGITGCSTVSFHSRVILHSQPRFGRQLLAELFLKLVGRIRSETHELRESRESDV